MSEIPINNEGKNVEEVIANDLCPVEIFENIYEIFVKGKKSGWLIKTYKKSKYARIESENLERLADIEGVPKILTYRIGEDFSFIIISEAKGVELREWVNKNGLLTEREVKKLVRKLLRILVLIHSKGVIHKDIKPENIMYHESSGEVVLIDFEGKHTDDFRSPEQVLGKKLTDKTDMWSLGITIYDLTRTKLPFHGEKEILRKDLTFSKRWSEDFIDFLECILDRDPEQRYSSKEALDHVWLN